MIQQAFAVVLAPVAAFIVHHAPMSQKAVWGLMLLGAFFMSLVYPGSKNVSARKIVEWGFVQPMVAAGSIVMYFVMFEGYPISLDLVLLGVALFLLFVMSTQVAFLAHAVPELLTDKRFQGMLKQQPATLAVFTLTLFFLSAMFMEIIPH
ncbi:hypothetical protein EOW65_19640 [Sinirhodobacter ferrireducens]|uniref:Uncharacterized protein n=1 Tax=Paenirhodobacter ferrireducens TaxID=1215032 RepID=A0A443L3Y2_9RHOB|nr:hypothetical protein [Sinirhodobacter ferrireducens]RWR43919.1 hypothetical protein EOW65_19640 [Sinirhodobacter ferrireducens]